MSVRAWSQKTNARQTETFTFLTINDPYSPNNTGIEPLRKLVADTRGMAQPPAFVVSTGNLTPTGSRRITPAAGGACSPCRR